MKFLGAALAVFGCSLADSAGPVSAPQLEYATYVGTYAYYATFTGLAVDSAGNSYVAGTGQDSSAPNCVTKLNRTGTAMVWQTCFQLLEVDSIAVDSASAVYVVGAITASPAGASLVMKLSPDGQQTIYSTLIAGASAARIAVDHTGAAYITGQADASFLATPGAYSTKPRRGVFVAKLNPTGAMAYATYLDILFVYSGVGIDSAGNAWVAGTSCAAVGVPNCDPTVVGYASAVQKLDAQGANLLASITFGGGQAGDHVVYRDEATAVAVDPDDNVWVAGEAQSAGVPTTPNGIEPQRPNAPTGVALYYAVKLSPSGEVLYGTYFGGLLTQLLPTALAVDTQGNAYLGLTLSTLASKLVALSSDGSSLLVSENIADSVEAIALDGNGGLYAATGAEDPVLPDAPNYYCPTTPGAYEPFGVGGSYNICLSKYDLTQSASAQVSKPVSAAVFGQSIVAPGEIVTLFGTNLPPNPVVTFDGIITPILYTDASQINAVVPFEVNPPLTVLTVQGVAGYNVPVFPSWPGLFTANGSGNGQVAALNEDGTINSSSNPAVAGSFVTVYMTGAGAMMPSLSDGQPGPLVPPFPAPVLNVTATIGGVAGFDGPPAPVVRAFQAPGAAAGLVEVVLQIPAGTAGGDVPLRIKVGDYQSPPNYLPFYGTTIAVQ